MRLHHAPTSAGPLDLAAAAAAAVRGDEEEVTHDGWDTTGMRHSALIPISSIMASTELHPRRVESALLHAAERSTPAPDTGTGGRARTAPNARSGTIAITYVCGIPTAALQGWCGVIHSWVSRPESVAAV